MLTCVIGERMRIDGQRELERSSGMGVEVDVRIIVEVGSGTRNTILTFPKSMTIRISLTSLSSGGQEGSRETSHQIRHNKARECSGGSLSMNTISISIH